MNEKHAYRAHRVELVLLETMRGRYRWIAFIDGDHMSVGPEALTSLREARRDALHLVHALIDTFESTRSTATSPPLHETTGALQPIPEPAAARRPSAA